MGIQGRGRSSPVRSANCRWLERTGLVMRAWNIDDKSLEEVDPSCLAADPIIAWKICRGSPWLTTKIAHLHILIVIWISNNSEQYFIYNKRKKEYPWNSDSISRIAWASLEATSSTLSPPSGRLNGSSSSRAQISSYFYMIQHTQNQHHHSFVTNSKHKTLANFLYSFNLQIHSNLFSCNQKHI